MMKIRLNTSTVLQGSLQDISVPTRVRIPLQEKHKSVVKKKQIVGCGQVIAEISSKSAYNLGFVHSSINGMVEDILPDAIIVGPIPAPKEGEEAPVPARTEPCAELDTLAGEELCRKLLELGVTTSGMHATRTVIVNGLNPEPGMIASEHLLESASETLKAGIQLLERALKPGSIKLVIATGRQFTVHGCTTITASDVYPATIDPLVIYAATGAERPDNVDILSVVDLYHIGRVAETKLPFTQSVVSVKDKVFCVPVGTAVEDLLTAAAVSIGPDKIVTLGGPMRGASIFDMAIGIDKSCSAITMVDVGQFPPVQPNPCINCGECVLACPARIHPGMLSRYAEFEMFDEARSHHVEACLECGMCTFVCPANRPVLQYLLLAKAALIAQDEEVAACRLQDL